MTRDDIINYLEEHDAPYYPHTLNQVLNFIQFDAKERILERTKWHNLETDPTDLPPSDGEYLVKVQFHKDPGYVHNFLDDYYAKTNIWGNYDGLVLAWKYVE